MNVVIVVSCLVLLCERRNLIRKLATNGNVDTKNIQKCPIIVGLTVGHYWNNAGTRRNKSITLGKALLP